MTRRLALTVLAPTVLVSLALVGACLFGVLYLNNLHENVVRDYSENRESHEVAASLEEAVAELRRLVSSDPLSVPQQQAEAEKLLVDAKRLANSDRESELVAQVAQGLDWFRQTWPQRPTDPAKQASWTTTVAKETESKVLRPCLALRQYNIGEELKSDKENQQIVLTVKWVLLLVGLGAPLLGLLLGYSMARGLHHSIHQLSVRIRDAAGRLNCELGSVTLDAQGDLSGLHRQMQGVIKEIERVVQELQQREHEVLHAEQLVALGQVAAGVAHELRNPLTSVKMLVQTGLEGQPASGLPPDDLTIIENEVRRMEVCIQSFLDFARPPRSERRHGDLNETVRRALALIEGRANRQSVSVVAHLTEGPALLQFDPEQIHQVFLNLLLNSLDALPHGGRITVFVRHPATDRVEVRVQDTGKGIVPPILERLFEPFLTSKETGLGLGLSISKRLIEAHGGTISGMNAPEGGAVFVFTLPV
jgi:signal transduction histidine kinase